MTDRGPPCPRAPTVQPHGFKQGRKQMYVLEVRIAPPVFYTGAGWSTSQRDAYEYLERKDALSKAMRMRNKAPQFFKDKIIVKAVP